MTKIIGLKNKTALIITDTAFDGVKRVSWYYQGEIIDSGRFTDDTLNFYDGNWEQFVEENMFIV